MSKEVEFHIELDRSVTMHAGDGRLAVSGRMKPEDLLERAFSMICAAQTGFEKSDFEHLAIEQTLKSMQFLFRIQG